MEVSKVPVEKVILINPFLKEERVAAKNIDFMEVTPPSPGSIKRGVEKETYENYNLGLERACADIVITVRLPSGAGAVLASKRINGKPFGGKWWMQGGAFHPYRSIIDFLGERAEKECGVRPKVEGLIGVFRTCAEDHSASTIQPCYVGRVSYEGLIKAKPDIDHISWALLKLEDLQTLPEEEKHWYPMLAFKLALESI